jgi:F-type H+-transporting ATPase subunit c
MTKRVFFALALMLIASSVLCAQTTSGGGASSDSRWALYIGSGFAMAIASGLCGLAQGKAVAACAEAMARNPGAGERIQNALILGLVLIESMALYTLAIVFLKVK